MSSLRDRQELTEVLVATTRGDDKEPRPVDIKIGDETLTGLFVGMGPSGFIKVRTIEGEGYLNPHHIIGWCYVDADDV